MQFRRGATAFYFTEEKDGGMTDAQQLFAADLVMDYQHRFRGLRITAVWDFGKEEGDPAEGEKYGRYEDSKVNAVYNASMLTISLNHARLKKLPCEADQKELADILAEYDHQQQCMKQAAHLEGELLCAGVPWPQTGERLREMLDVHPCRGNALDIRDPYFADVQAIRMLEDTQSIERILVHEIGHMLFEESGADGDKALRKLFTKCRDGFEDRYEFCAECFMASEMTAGAVRDGQPVVIPLAQQVREILDDHMK